MIGDIEAGLVLSIAVALALFLPLEVLGCVIADRLDRREAERTRDTTGKTLPDTPTKPHS